MPTGKQIRAARVLLDWKVEDLAAHSGVNRESILHAERGERRTRVDTMGKITSALSASGIEFLDNNGVRQRPEGLDVLNGTGGLEAFFDQVYTYLSSYGGLVCVSGADEAQFARSHGAEHASQHVTRINQLVRQRGDIEFRVLLRDGDTNFMANEYCSYRWQQKESFEATPFYVFGENLALITFQANPSPKIMVIRSEAFASAFRKQFNISWGVARVPPEERPGE